LQRQLDGHRVRFAPADRAWLAALLHHLRGPDLRRGRRRRRAPIGAIAGQMSADWRRVPR
jgi:hypothetical protein